MLVHVEGVRDGADTADPVIARGTDICLLLNKGFERRKVPARVRAVLNDTTGTLISGAYTVPADKPPASSEPSLAPA